MRWLVLDRTSPTHRRRGARRDFATALSCSSLARASTAMDVGGCAAPSASPNPSPVGRAGVAHPRGWGWESSAGRGAPRAGRYMDGAEAFTPMGSDGSPSCALGRLRARPVSASGSSRKASRIASRVASRRPQDGLRGSRAAGAASDVPGEDRVRDLRDDGAPTGRPRGAHGRYARGKRSS